MLDKHFLKDLIIKNFPDLENTSFEFNDKQSQSFSKKYLLPFLIYQNTVDSNNRLISLFLPNDKSLTNLIPFYVILGQYRKAIDIAMNDMNFQNQTFKLNEKPVSYNGEICSLILIDFINRKIHLQSGRGSETQVTF